MRGRATRAGSKKQKQTFAKDKECSSNAWCAATILALLGDWALGRPFVSEHNAALSSLLSPAPLPGYEGPYERHGLVKVHALRATWPDLGYEHEALDSERTCLPQSRLTAYYGQEGCFGHKGFFGHEALGRERARLLQSRLTAPYVGSKVGLHRWSPPRVELAPHVEPLQTAAGLLGPA